MPGCRTITHNGQTIHYFDYSGCDAETFLRVFDQANSILLAHSDEDRLCFIANFAGVPMTQSTVKAIHNVKSRQANRGVYRGAILGADRFKRVVLNTFNAITGKRYRAFADLESALVYLTGK